MPSAALTLALLREKDTLVGHRMDEVIKGHPKAFGVPVKDQREDDGHSHAPDEQWNKGDAGIDRQRDCDRGNEQLAQHQVDGHCTSIVARLTLVFEIAGRTTLVGFEEPRVELALTAHWTAQQ